MVQSTSQLRNERRHARQKQRRMAGRKLFKSEKPRIPRRSSFPTKEELEQGMRYPEKDLYQRWLREKEEGL